MNSDAPFFRGKVLPLFSCLFQSILNINLSDNVRVEVILPSLCIPSAWFLLDWYSTYSENVILFLLFSYFGIASSWWTEQYFSVVCKALLYTCLRHDQGRTAGIPSKEWHFSERSAECYGSSCRDWRKDSICILGESCFTPNVFHWLFDMKIFDHDFFLDVAKSVLLQLFYMRAHTHTHILIIEHITDFVLQKEVIALILVTTGYTTNRAVKSMNVRVWDIMCLSFLTSISAPRIAKHWR